MKPLLILLVIALSCVVPALAAKPPARKKPAPADPAPVVDAQVPSFVDHVPIKYDAEGKGSPAIVFIHCWMCDSSYWKEEVAAFAPTHRVVTLDLPGHGASGKDRKAWTMTAYGGDVKTVVEQLGLGKVILVGHSMGGFVMLEAAKLMPEHVVGMIAIDTLHDADQKDDPKQSAEWLDSMRTDFRGNSEKLVRMIVGPKADPAVVQGLVDRTVAGDPAIGVALMEQMDKYNLADAFKRVANVPLVAIQSTLRPTNVAANRKYLKKYQVLYLPDGVGHYPQVESPAELVTLIAEALKKL